MSQPLTGLTVIELSTMITASFAAMMLGEQGARVIKIEPTDMGDPMRYIGMQKGGQSALFAGCNRGKESIRVNLKSAAGQGIVRKLAESADVLLHNFRPGVMDGVNLGSETLRAANPKLIYAAVSGFGTKGPLSSAPAYDPIVQAQAGITAVQGQGDNKFIRNLICDKITAYTACQAVTAALFERERSGAGQHIDLSMLDAGLFFMFPDGFMNHALLDDDVAPQPLLADLLYELTETADGHITISAGMPHQRLGMLKAIGKAEEIGSDPRFATMDKLVENIVAYQAITRAAFKELTTAEALARLKANDVPCGECLDRDQALGHEQISANDTAEIVSHPGMGQLRVIKSPAKFAGERLPVGRLSPGHGEHTDSVLEGYGFSAADRDALREAGDIA